MPQTYDYGDLEVKPKAPAYNYGSLEQPAAAPITPEDTRTSQEQGKPWVSPTNPLYAPLEGTRESLHMLGNQLQGAPQAITGIPSTISNGASALWDMISGKGTGKAQAMVEGALKPATTSLQGAGALIAPASINAPSEQEFNQAAQGAGANAAGLALGEAGSRLLKRGAIPADTPAELYRGALKRGVQVGSDISKNRALAEIGLKYGIGVSEAGLDKLDGLVKDFETSITSEVGQGAAAGVTVNKYRVASRLTPMAQRAQLQANPAGDLAAISKAGNEFLDAHPAEIPADQALQIKKGTYRAVGDRAYGEESTAAAQSQKNLARGVNEELGNLFPNIKPQLTSEGELLSLRKAIDKAVNKQANAPAGRGLMTLATGGVVKTLTGSGLAGTGAAILKGVLDDPAVRSELAIALSKAQGGNKISSSAQAMFQVMKVSGALGAAQREANSETDH